MAGVDQESSWADRWDQVRLRVIGTGAVATHPASPVTRAKLIHEMLSLLDSGEETSFNRLWEYLPAAVNEHVPGRVIDALADSFPTAMFAHPDCHGSTALAIARRYPGLCSHTPHRHPKRVVRALADSDVGRMAIATLSMNANAPFSLRLRSPHRRFALLPRSLRRITARMDASALLAVSWRPDVTARDVTQLARVAKQAAADSYGADNGAPFLAIARFSAAIETPFTAEHIADILSVRRAPQIDRVTALSPRFNAEWLPYLDLRVVFNGPSEQEMLAVLSRCTPDAIAKALPAGVPNSTCVGCVGGIPRPRRERVARRQ